MTDLLMFALGQYGVAELKGDGQHNDVIVNYFKEIGHKWVSDDETAWCSAFMNYCAKMVGREMSGKLNARSWLNVGEEVEEPQPGDVVIFWRGSKDSWKGHVAIFINKDENYHYVLGGNQSNMVKISPYANYRVLGYRRLKCAQNAS